jgi:hypothetical protein
MTLSYSKLLVKALKPKKMATETHVTHKPGYWKQRENRRQFLIQLAISKGLDPFVARTWYKISRKDIQDAKVCYL